MFLSSTKGTYLEQLKEPALSRDIVIFEEERTPQKVEIPQKENYSLQDLIRISKRGSIIDEYSGKYLSDILKQIDRTTITTVVADAVNDEPYISNQMNPFLKYPSEVVFSLGIISDAVNAGESFVAIYRHIYDCEQKIPKIVQDVEVKKMSGKYPVEVKSKLFNSKDILVLGAGCLIHLCRLIKQNKEQTTTFITVAGNCIGNPCNMEVPLGTPISKVLDKCGLISNPEKIILGDPMRGRCAQDIHMEEVRIDTKAVLAFCKLPVEKVYSCIRCGKCEVSCPMDLNPMYIFKAINKNKHVDAASFGAGSCIGCGTCSYVCPARLNLSSVIFNYSNTRKEKEECVQCS